MEAVKTIDPLTPCFIKARAAARAQKNAPNNFELLEEWPGKRGLIDKEGIFFIH